MKHLTEQRLERANKAVSTYRSLLAYWTAPRMIGTSVRLDQSAELIQEQAQNAREHISYWFSAVSRLTRQLKEEEVN